METYIQFFKRHFVWIFGGLVAAFLLVPSFAEIRTILLLIIAECIAIALSSIAQNIYTKIDFTQTSSPLNLGLIFLSVHILTGLTILGVYLAQFA